MFAIHIFIFIYMCECSAILSVQIFIAHMCCQVILTFKVFVNTEQITEEIFRRVSMVFFCVDKYCVLYNRNTLLFSLFSSVCSLSNWEHKERCLRETSMEGLHNYCQGKRHLMRMCNFIIPTHFQVQRDLKILSAEEHHRFWEKLIKDHLRALKV